MQTFSLNSVVAVIESSIDESSTRGSPTSINASRNRNSWATLFPSICGRGWQRDVLLLQKCKRSPISYVIWYFVAEKFQRRVVSKHLQNELSRWSFTYREEAGESDFVQKCRKFIGHCKDDASNETETETRFDFTHG